MPSIGKDFPIISPSVLTAQEAGVSSLDKTARISKELDGNGTAPSDKAIKDSATQFEALLLQQMLKAMWATVPKNHLLGDGKEEEYFRGMFDEAISKEISVGQGLGIKEVIERDIRAKERK